jgi:hypothetical protein
MPDAPPGWAVSWLPRTKRFDSFSLTPNVPYTASITWRRDAVEFRLTDGTGAVLYERSRPLRANATFMAARMSYWLMPEFEGTLPGPVIVRSFKFTPLSRLAR